MTPAEIKTQRLTLVAQRAMRGYDDLAPTQRIELLLALAEVLPEAEAEAARHTAFVLQEAEAHQLKFKQLIPAA